jgi:hypothetical protein
VHSPKIFFRQTRVSLPARVSLTQSLFKLMEPVGESAMDDMQYTESTIILRPGLPSHTALVVSEYSWYFSTNSSRTCSKSVNRQSFMDQDPIPCVKSPG